ncbi:ETS translocation variant 3-like protein, partial [Columba livia]
GLGVQARVQPRLAADPAVALHPGAAAAGALPRGHRLAGRLRRVRHQGPGRGGAAVGRAQVQAAHELRQAQPRAQ